MATDKIVMKDISKFSLENGNDFCYIRYSTTTYKSALYLTEIIFAIIDFIPPIYKGAAV